MAMRGSNLANTAAKAVTSGNSQFGSDTPWARAIANAGGGGYAAENAARNGMDIAPGDNSSTVSNRNTMMPPMQADGTYSWKTPVAPTAPAWSLEGDPLYRSALEAGKSAFSFAQAQALADKQNQQTAGARQTKQIDTAAAESRRRLAGNYAARGMAGGGSASALAMAEARANAEQVAARTSIQDQLTALNNQYLENFGDASVVDPVTGKSTYDWTGTLAGQQYKTQAAQAAIQAQLARYGAA
jgi:hypothetical protein